MAHSFTKDILLDRPEADIKHVLSGVSSTSLDRAKAFLGEFKSEGQAYGSVEDLARDPAINAIYIASPTSLHYRHAVTCLRARKAVLLEVITDSLMPISDLTQLFCRKPVRRSLLRFAIGSTFFLQSLSMRNRQLTSYRSPKRITSTLPRHFGRVTYPLRRLLGVSYTPTVSSAGLFVSPQILQSPMARKTSRTTSAMLG